MWDIQGQLKNCPCLSEIQTYLNCPVFYLPTLILRFCWDGKSSLEKLWDYYKAWENTEVCLNYAQL